MPLSGLRLVSDDNDDHQESPRVAPVNAIEVLIAFFSTAKLADSLLEVNMAAADALDALRVFLK